MSRGTGLPGPLHRVLNQRRSRFLFEWQAGDGTLAARSGQAPTFSRASVGGAVPDQQGRLWTPPHSLPSWTCVDLDGDGVRESLALQMDPARTNLVLQSENFGTTWVPIGTPTRAAAASSLGALVLDNLGDDTAAALEGYSQVIGFSGDAVKAISHFWRPGSGTFVGRLRQTSGTPADKLLWTISSGGALTAVTGAAIGVDTWGVDSFGSPVKRILLQSASVLAGQTNQLELYPASTSGLAVGNIGDALIGGVQAENAAVPSGYVKTTTGAVARSADLLQYPWLVRPTAMTFYLKFIERGQLAAGGAGGLVGIGNSVNAAVFLHDSGGLYTMTHRRGSDVSSSPAVAPAFGQLVELRGVLNADGSVQLGQSINGGAENVGAVSAANTLASAWSDNILTVNDRTTSGAAPGMGTYQAIRIAAGVRTLAQMR